jgi:hypothetical protein
LPRAACKTLIHHKANAPYQGLSYNTVAGVEPYVTGQFMNTQSPDAVKK